MEGRMTFTPSLWRAADFIAAEYAEIGLEPYVGNAASGGVVGEGAEHANPYFQHMNVIRSTTESCEVTINGAAIAADRVACRIGADSVELGLDDVELVRMGDDPMAVARQVFGADGHVLVLMGSDQIPVFHRFSGFLSRAGGSLEGSEGAGAPSVALVLLNVPAADYVVDSVSITGTATTEALPLANVIGQITGNRPDEYVIFSAHYDHVGVRDGMEGDNIFNGANDDASGVTGIIELARYFKSLPKPERTIVFLAFTAEESGGYGSRYYAGSVDPEQVVAMVNIEMIGKPAKAGPGSTWITGFDRSSLGEIMNAAVQGHSYEFTPDPYPDQGLFMRSDNAPLAALGVPAHSFSSTPMDEDPDYHQPSDEVETLDLANMTELIRAMALGIAPIISGEQTPTRVVAEEGQ
jgi:hypothetical protein